MVINTTKKSYVADCAMALLDTVLYALDREHFIQGLELKGWTVKWEDKRNQIVFINENGDKVRDTTIEKTFAGMKVNKEDLLNEFKRTNEAKYSKHRTDKHEQPRVQKHEQPTYDIEDRESITAKLERYVKEVNERDNRSSSETSSS